jgi:hypothetical protein
MMNFDVSIIIQGKIYLFSEDFTRKIRYFVSSIKALPNYNEF